jgi:hypothetical protein
MKRALKTSIALAAFTLCASFTSYGAPACTLYSFSGGWVHIKLYQETPQGTKGSGLWDGVITGGHPKVIDTTSVPRQRIRFDYSTSPSVQPHGNVGAWCKDGDQVPVP